MKRILLFTLLSLFTFTRCDEVIEGLSSLTQSEVAQGLKEALTIGSANAVDIVGVVDGFFKNPEIKIPLPEQTKVITNLLNSSIIPSSLLDPLKSGINQVEEKLNRAAETASKEAVDVFKTAITQMTITDAISILKGGDNAATKYLEKTTSDVLREKFTPIVSSANEKIELANYWNDLSGAYNKIAESLPILGLEPVNVDLTEYVTDKALDGLFVMVAKEELKIRTDPGARVTDVLKKVFGSDLNPHNENENE